MPDIKAQAKQRAKKKNTPEKKPSKSKPKQPMSVQPPSNDPMISNTPLPRIAWMRSFSAIPGLRKGEGEGGSN